MRESKINLITSVKVLPPTRRPYVKTLHEGFTEDTILVFRASKDE